MEKTYYDLLEEAREQFYGGVRGRGAKGTFFHRLYKFWNGIRKTYIATTDALSCINWPERRSNQEMEASNKFKNAQKWNFFSKKILHDLYANVFLRWSLAYKATDVFKFEKNYYIFVSQIWFKRLCQI